MTKCSRCNCPEYRWNPMAVVRGEGLRICLCSHHENYHGCFKKFNLQNEKDLEAQKKKK